jgi:hypothetical protein
MNMPMNVKIIDIREKGQRKLEDVSEHQRGTRERIELVFQGQKRERREGHAQKRNSLTKTNQTTREKKETYRWTLPAPSIYFIQYRPKMPPWEWPTIST